MAAAATAGDQVLMVELGCTNDAPLRLHRLTEVLELSDHIHVLRDGRWCLRLRPRRPPSHCCMS